MEILEISNNKIERIKKNLFYRSVDAIPDYKNFKWHRYNNEPDSDKIKSSQALCIDFWGCLLLSNYKDNLINYLLQ